MAKKDCSKCYVTVHRFGWENFMKGLALYGLTVISFMIMFFTAPYPKIHFLGIIQMPVMFFSLLGGCFKMVDAAIGHDEQIQVKGGN